ncbi:glycoside hydrolase family 5 protein [Flammula alnicola]|nr:glycoside hydrolase family 5 protein [Flammula alnicola]
MPNMSLALCLVVILQFWIASATDLIGRWNNSSFVSVSGGHFQLDGSLWRFYGTNAYWLQMSTDNDIDSTFHSIATAGFRVVRTWAFNDVSNKPSSGTYFQILENGQATINTGPDGLQRLDQVVATASKYGIKLLLTLTNNWNPERPAPSSSWNRRWANSGELPRGYLSNDYGGIDLYVRNFHPSGTHDLFYTDSTIISAFKNYIAQVIQRYANNPTVLGWELGNDLRCSSTLPASSSCNTETITKWVAEISNYVKSIDSNHLVTAGDGGFYCLSCKKLYAKQSTQPNPTFPGPSFDGSYGVDTEDILASPCVDFGSFQLFPDQVDYFPETNPSSAVKAIGDGGKWTAVHSNTATLLRKPEVLTAMAIITKDHWKFFVPFNGTSRSLTLYLAVRKRGVEAFQQTYAFTSWSGASLNGMSTWVQAGLTSHGTTHKRDLTQSPNDGSGHYNGPASGQTAAQFLASLPPIP